jgi:hypothetical protein
MLAQKVAPSSPWRCTTSPNFVAVSTVTLCSSLVALEMPNQTKQQPQNHDAMHMFEANPSTAEKVGVVVPFSITFSLPSLCPP